MATEQPKAAAPQEHPFPIAPYPHQHFNGGSYAPPHPGTYPSYYAYPPPTEGNHNDSNGHVGPTYMMAFPPPPPGMVYAFPPPPPGQAMPFTQGVNTPQAPVRPKRKQVKMACTNCAAACKRCDEARPCERCIKYGVAETCVDGQRKERKKGVKRGPYKRKNKTDGSADPSSIGADSEWSPTSPTQAPTSTATTTAAMHAVAQYTAPEFYPYYYPPPPGAYIPMHDGPGQPATTDAGAPQHPPNGQQPPMMPYYIHGGYPPYPHYPPHPGYVPQPPPPQHQPSTLDPTETAGAKKDNVGDIGKKRARGAKNSSDPKAKKVKTSTRPPKVNGDDTNNDSAEGGGEPGNSA